MTDVRAVPPTEDRDAVTPSGPPGPAAHAPAATNPLVVTVSLLGVLLTGLCLAAADLLDRSPAARPLAVGAVVTALVAVLVALGAQISAPASGRPGRRGVLVVRAAGLLSMLAVLLAGAAALFAVSPRETAAVATEPTVVVERTFVGAGPTTVTAQVTFPGLRAGTALDVTMRGLGEDSARYVLAHSAVHVGADGPAVVRLAVAVASSEDIVIEANAPGRRCTASLPPQGVIEGTAGQVTCTTH